MPSLLVCYDYGQGGIWLYIEAENPEQIKQKYPSLTVFEAPPAFWNDELEKVAREHDPKKSPFWADWLDRLMALN